MVFWAGIAVGGAFVLWAIKKGFYETWVTLFNTVIAIYLAIFLRPTIVTLLPAAGDTPYSNALIMLVIWVASFTILSGLSYIFFTSNFNVTFPKVIDIIGSGIVGFFNGWLIWSFLCLLLAATPLSQNQIMEEIGFGAAFRQTNNAYIKLWVDKVNNLVSVKSDFLSTDAAITELMNPVEKKEVKKQRRVSPVNEPNSSISCPPSKSLQDYYKTSENKGNSSYDVNPPKADK
jgi:uncharacterized membrane protein required for colicin V production